MSDQDEIQLPQWGPGKTARGRARLPWSRQRERPTLSCKLCRRRKLRCDRQHPCGTCTQRGLALSCAYSPNVLSTADAGALPRPPPMMQERIQQLETLVVDLMQKTSARLASHEASQGRGPRLSASPAPHQPPSEVDRSADDVSPDSDHGSIRLANSGVSYVHGSHWAAILDGISELKDHYGKEDEAQPDRSQDNKPSAPPRTGPKLLYGCSELPTKQEIIASVPARAVADRLVSRLFNSFEMSPAVLHSVEFLKEYEEFWADPSATPLAWLALLFTILCLATQLQKFRLDPGDGESAARLGQDIDRTIDTFRQSAIQCLILADYAKGGPYVLETLMLYMAVELFLRSDAEIGVWILLGTIVQLAMHMGYHRDPKHFQGMSPFKTEMRRRIWATVVELDIGISTQMGLPRLIKQWQTDTCEPSNLQDGDFGQATTVMPPSRPETDLTPMLYRLAKARLMTTIGYIWDFAVDMRTYTYPDMMKMDQRLQEGHASIPECLRWRSMAHCITNSPQIIMQKVFLEIMFHRARIVLHGRYLHPSLGKKPSGYSQRACIDAALTLLGYQHMLQQETQPFCQLYQERWRVSSLVNHDFLLATSILCLYIKQQEGTDDEFQNEAIRSALRRSYDIWLSSSSSSKEASRAAKALSFIFGSSGPEAETFTLPEAPTSSNVADCFQGFGVQFPVFDATVMHSWSFPSGEANESFLSPSTACDVEWPALDAVNPTSLQWPWNLP